MQQVVGLFEEYAAGDVSYATLAERHGLAVVANAVDREYRLSFVNLAYQQAVSQSAAQLLGRPIGEVRGAEALDLLKAWGTGHPGGIGT